MKKITFKNSLLFVMCLFALQMFAQSFPEGAWRLRTYLASPDGYNANTPPFLGQFVYPTSRDDNAMNLKPKDLTTNNQVFLFKPLNGQNVEWPATSGSFYQVYNIESAISGKGVMELNTLTEASQRMRLRGNAYPFNNDLAKFIVVQDAVNFSYRIIAVGATTNANRRLSATTNYDWLNFGGPAGGNTSIDEWIFEAATLSTNDFDTSSIFVSNPVNNELSIKGLTSKVKEVSIYSLLGKRVLQTKVNSKSSLKLDVSMLSSGIYILKMTSDSGSFSKKIIKE